MKNEPEREEGQESEEEEGVIRNNFLEDEEFNILNDNGEFNDDLVVLPPSKMEEE